MIKLILLTDPLAALTAWSLQPLAQGGIGAAQLPQGPWGWPLIAVTPKGPSILMAVPLVASLKSPMTGFFLPLCLVALFCLWCLWCLLTLPAASLRAWQA